MKRSKSISERARAYTTGLYTGAHDKRISEAAWVAGYHAGIKRETTETLRLRLALYLRSHDARRLAVPESQIPTVEVPTLSGPPYFRYEEDLPTNVEPVKDYLPMPEQRSGGSLKNAEFPEGTIVVEDSTGTHAILPNGRDLLNDTGNLRILRS